MNANKDSKFEAVLERLLQPLASAIKKVVDGAELVANKSQDAFADATDTNKYPSVPAMLKVIDNLKTEIRGLLDEIGDDDNETEIIYDNDTNGLYTMTLGDIDLVNVSDKVLTEAELIGATVNYINHDSYDNTDTSYTCTIATENLFDMSGMSLVSVDPVNETGLVILVVPNDNYVIDNDEMQCTVEKAGTYFSYTSNSYVSRLTFGMASGGVNEETIATYIDENVNHYKYYKYSKELRDTNVIIEGVPVDPVMEVYVKSNNASTEGGYCLEGYVSLGTAYVLSNSDEIHPIIDTPFEFKKNSYGTIDLVNEKKFVDVGLMVNGEVILMHDFFGDIVNGTTFTDYKLEAHFLNFSSTDYCRNDFSYRFYVYSPYESALNTLREELNNNIEKYISDYVVIYHHQPQPMIECEYVGG